MNMPKRASCHHFMRRARSASSASGAFCVGRVGGPEWARTPAALEVAASVTSDALVPTSQSRRGIRIGLMASASLEKLFRSLRMTSASKPREQTSRGMFGYYGLFFKLEDLLHQHPLFAGLRIRKRLLKSPHQLFPLAYLRVFTIGLRFLLEGELLIDFHHHEHAGAVQIDLHVFDPGVLDACGDFRPDFFVVALVFRNQPRIILQIQGQAIAFGHLASAVAGDSARLNEGFGL